VLIYFSSVISGQWAVQCSEDPTSCLLFMLLFLSTYYHLLLPPSTFIIQVLHIRASNQHTSMSVEQRNTISLKVLPPKNLRGVDDSTSCAHRSHRSNVVGSEGYSIATTTEGPKEAGASMDIATPKPASPVLSNASSAIVRPPFFHYVDRSSEPDDDTLTPLVPMARVPTFPAKIYGMFKLINST
jgi:hypothetical protein